jgi:hypothetical protein
MSDATGHMDWPGAGPFSVQVYVDGIPIPYYTHPNPITNRIELIEINPPGTPDQLLMDFQNVETAHLWIKNEFRLGRLRR